MREEDCPNRSSAGDFREVLIQLGCLHRRQLDPRLLRARMEVASNRVRRRIAAGRFHRIVDALKTFHRLVPDGALRNDPRDRPDRRL